MITTPVKQWRRQKEVTSLIGKTGKLIQWTMIYVPAKQMGHQAPYPIGIVRFDNNKQVIGQLVDFDKNDLVKECRVVAVLRRSTPETPESALSYIIKFRPDIS